MAQRVARTMGNAVCLILDACFAVGTVFTAAAQEKRRGLSPRASTREKETRTKKDKGKKK